MQFQMRACLLTIGLLSPICSALHLHKPTRPLAWDPSTTQSQQERTIDTRELNRNNGTTFAGPYDAWEHGVIAPFDFWRKTPEKVFDSKTVEFYEAFLEDYMGKDSFKCKEKDLGEFACFGWVYLGDHAFACTIDNVHMCRKPSAMEITKHVRKHWNDLSKKEVVDMSRQIYFASEIMQTMMANDHRYFRLISVMETYALSQVTDIVKAFTPQVDEMRQSSCELAKMLINLSIEIGAMAAQSFGGMIFKEVGGLLVENLEAFAPEKLQRFREKVGKAFPKMFADQVKGSVAERPMQTKVWGTLAAHALSFEENGYLERVMAAMGKFKDSSTDPEEARKIFEQHGKDSSAAPGLSLMISTASGMCGNDYGVIVNDNIHHETAVTDFIVDYTTKLRGRLDLRFRTLFKYQDQATESVSLVSFRAVALLAHDDIFNKDLQELEQSVKVSFQESLISRMLAQSRCYMKCEERDDAEKVCKHHNPKNPKSNESRFCPPNTNLRCQMARWTKQQRNNHEDFIPGFDGGFERYNITPRALSEGSWDYFQRNRAQAHTWEEVIDDFQKPRTTLHIPVCVSPIRTIEEITPAKLNDLSEKERWRKGFPFFCGNLQANETGSLLKAININPLEERELWHRILAKYLNRMRGRPARRYNLLCQLGVRWPQRNTKVTPKIRDRMHWLVKNSTDSQCEAFMKATKSMDEFEANYHLCTSDMMRATLKSELGYLINVVPNPRSHLSQCRRWLKKNRNQIAEKGPEAVKKYQATVEAAEREERIIEEALKQVGDEMEENDKDSEFDEVVKAEEV